MYYLCFVFFPFLKFLFRPMYFFEGGDFFPAETLYKMKCFKAPAQHW